MTIYTSPWPTVPLPEDKGLFEFVWSNPAGRPDDFVALTCGATGATYTRGDLKRDCQRLAYGFRHTLNLKPESVVCVLSSNSLDYYLLVLGMQCGGYVVSGANAAYTPQELAHQIEDSSTEIILCHPDVLNVALEATKKLGWSEEKQTSSIILAVKKDKTGPAAKRFRSYDSLMGDQILQPHKVKDTKNTVAFLGYSSGTSGKSKGVRTSHYNMTSVLSILKPFDLNLNDVQMAVLPLNHIYGLTKVLHFPIYQGHSVVVMPRFDLEQFCSLVQKHKATVCLLVPPIALLLAREPVVAKYDLSSLRLLVSGAAPLGKELEAELSKRLGTSVAQAYGLTEASPTTHFCPLSNPKPGSIGPLLPMMRGRICDPISGEDLQPGQEGEMLLQGPNIMLGYLNRPEANAETLMTDKDGVWLKTGDVAYVDKEGYFYVTDRLKELIKFKGFQVAPAELEGTLLECPYVSDAAVIGVYDDNQATELPRAYVVLSAEGKKKANATEAVREWVDAKVARHKKLRGGVKVIDVIPKSPSGKLLRRILRDQAKAEQAQAETTKAKL